MKHRVRAWEWVVAACGAAFVIGVIGWLTYTALTRAESPPELAVEVTGIRPSGAHFLVLVRVRNTGGSTAAKTVVEGTLRRGGTVVEVSRLEFDYVPPASDRNGGLLFRSDPRGLELEIRPVSWTEP